MWGVEEIEFFRHFSKQVLGDGEGNSAPSELRSFAVRVDESLVNSQFVPIKVVTIVMNSGTGCLTCLIPMTPILCLSKLFHLNLNGLVLHNNIGAFHFKKLMRFPNFFHLKQMALYYMYGWTVDWSRTLWVLPINGHLTLTTCV